MKVDPQKHCINYKQNLFWAIVHDLIAHPLMPLSFYSGWSIMFHDYTSRKAWNRLKET